jgi:hypothetical protein
MYDFEEFLARGIIAVRSGKFDEAFTNLNFAVQVKPDNTRAWLWLSSAAGSDAARREALQHVLTLDPDHYVARVLLGRLAPHDTGNGSAPVGVSVFTCPGCGGRQYFDPDLSGLVCESCRRLEPLGGFARSPAENRLDAATLRGAGNWSLVDGEGACRGCGATFTLAAGDTTLTCPFCQSTQVLTRPATPGLINPTAIIPFALQAEAARQALRQWLERVPLTPDRLTLLPDKYIQLTPVYLPFWVFKGRARVRCQVYRYSDHTYSDKERVVVDKSEWPNITAWFEYATDSLWLYAGCSVPPAWMSRLLPMQRWGLLAYRPELLAGWQAEMYQLALQDAAVEAHKRLRDQATRRAWRKLVIYDPQAFLADDVSVEKDSYQLALAPLWVGSYQYQGSTYPAWVNGQTGKVAAQTPVDWPFVGLLITMGLLALGLEGWVVSMVLR